MNWDALLRCPWAFLHWPAFCLGLTGYAASFFLMLAAFIRHPADHSRLSKLHRWSLCGWLFLTAGILIRFRAAYSDVCGPAMWTAAGDAPIFAWLAGTALLHVIALHRQRGGFRQPIAILLTITFALCIISVLTPFPAHRSILQSLGKLPLIAVLAMMACMAACPLIGRERRHSVRGLTAAGVAFLLLAAIMIARKMPLPAALAFSLGAAVAASVASDIWHVIASRPADSIRLIAGRIAHLGFAILAIGAMGIGVLGTRAEQPARKDTHIFAGNYMVQFRGLSHLFTVEFVLSNDKKGFRETFSPAVGEVVHTEAAVLQLDGVDFERKTARFWVGQTTSIDGDDIAYAPAEEMELTPSQPLTLNDGTVLAFGKVTRNAGPGVANLVAAKLDVYRIDRPAFEKVRTLRPEVVVYAGSDRPQSRGAIWTTPGHDLCAGLTLHPQLGPVVTVALRPFAIWTWIGGIIMLAGATVALAEGRKHNADDGMKR